MLIIFAAFWILLIATLARKPSLALLRSKGLHAWLLDLSGLAVQGAVVPLLQVVAVFALLRAVVPDLERSVALAPFWAFCLNFVVIDYLYYLNHRTLHTQLLWPTHRVHHTAEEMDVLVTSRNTLWTPVLIVYLWGNALAAFALSDPSWFLLASAISAALDLWRHSPLYPATKSWSYKVLALVLITPLDHAWHHSADGRSCNFGANLNLWDRLHGTYVSHSKAPRRIGITDEQPFIRQLLWPFGETS